MPVRKRVSAKLSTVKQETVTPEVVAASSVKDKLKQPKVFVPLIIIALILAAFYLKGLFVVALINGEPISRLTIIQELEKQGGKQALSSLVNQTLILQEAKKKNVQVIQAEIDKAEKKIEDSLKAQGQSLDTALAMQGMTRKDLALQLKLRSLVEKLLADKIKVTEKEIADYIEKNKSTFPATLTSDQIKTSVEEQLKQQKMASESQSWIEGLKKNAKINYFVNY
jgi:parvulin-like peptidyl-prolyl isomerase